MEKQELFLLFRLLHILQVYWKSSALTKKEYERLVQLLETRKEGNNENS